MKLQPVHRKIYPTDLSDQQWQLVASLLPEAKSNTLRGGRPRSVDLRETLNAIFYLLRSGCSWRMLPHDFPQWPTVKNYFYAWQADGTWQQIHDTLRSKVRAKARKKPQPTAAILDSQSVKTTEKGGFVALMPVRR